MSLSGPEHLGQCNMRCILSYQLCIIPLCNRCPILGRCGYKPSTVASHEGCHPESAWMTHRVRARTWPDAPRHGVAPQARAWHGSCFVDDGGLVAGCGEACMTRCDMVMSQCVTGVAWSALARARPGRLTYSPVSECQLVSVMAPPTMLGRVTPRPPTF